LTGERYADLPNAFRYRNEYVESCACGPNPWSDEAKAVYDRRAVLATRTEVERARAPLLPVPQPKLVRLTPALRRPWPDAISPSMAKQRLLFVCLGNICRSPMAEGVFRRVAEDEGVLQLFHIDSAGLGDWHAGQAPDTRAQSAARNRGIDISAQSARQIAPADFARFDLLLAMDGSNYQELIELAPSDSRHKIRRFLDFAPHAGTQDVPDPFFGGGEGFDHALDLIEQAARGLLAELLSGDSTLAKRGAQSSSG
jgi:low molecular weight protein-tyrosine phosphatase